MRSKIAAVATAAMLALGLVAFEGSAQAACPVFADQTTPPAFSGNTVGQVSGLAHAMYFVSANVVGGSGLINLLAGAYPGWTKPNGRGFTGTGSTIYVSYVVPAGAPSGSYSDVEVKVLDIDWRTVCSDVFRVHVP